MLTSMVALQGKFLLLHVSNHEYLYKNKQNLLPSPRTQRVVCLQEEVKIPKKYSASLREVNSRSLTVTRPQCKHRQAFKHSSQLQSSQGINIDFR